MKVTKVTKQTAVNTMDYEKMAVTKDELKDIARYQRKYQEQMEQNKNSS